MKRRALLQRLGATAATSVAWPLGLNAQQRSQPPLVGIFTTTDASGRSLISDETDAFHQAMRDLGYIEGRNISYVYRSISDQMPSPPEIAQSVPEFVRRKPEVIVSPGGVVSVRLLMEATSTIPIVMVTAFDAVENGLVPSLAHPGGNVTGLSTQSTDLSTKRLQLLHETLPFCAPDRGVYRSEDASARPRRHGRGRPNPRRRTPVRGNIHTRHVRQRV
jgi:putative ABC transport system substrate-binding protein